MFGFGKKTISIDQFGLGVLRYSGEFISADALRSLGSRFEDYDASRGWTPVFKANGVPIETVKLYLHLYTHCVLQTVFKGFSQFHRQAMVRGAMSGLAETPTEYNYNNTFTELESAFEENYGFDPKVEPLKNPEARLTFLANPNAGVIASKYLIDRFIIPNMKNSGAFINDFAGYSVTFASSAATAKRASDQITAQFKISS